jgi:hypothetical protein
MPILRAPAVAPPPRTGRAVVIPAPTQAPRRFGVPGVAARALVSGTVRLTAAFSYTPGGWLSGQASALAPPNPPTLTLLNGAGVGQVLYAFDDTVLFSGSPVLLDLQQMLDPGNLPFSFQAARYLYVRNYSTTAPLYLGGPTPGEWAGPWEAGSVARVGPSTSGAGTAANNPGLLEIWDPVGIPVTSLSHVLKLDPRGASFAADILIVGA